MRSFKLLKTQEETEQKKTLEEVNHILLKNILPEHVANHFIKVGQSDDVSWPLVPTYP